MLAGLVLANMIIIATAMKYFYVLDFRVRGLFSTLVESRKFSTISLVAGLFSVVAGNILVVYFNDKLSSDIYLALVVFQRFVVAPLGVISRIFFDVFKSELAGAQRSEFYAICSRFTIRMGLMGLGIIFMIFPGSYAFGYIRPTEQL